MSNLSPISLCFDAGTLIIDHVTNEHEKLLRTLIHSLVTLDNQQTLYFNSLLARNPNRNKALKNWDADLFLSTGMNKAKTLFWFDGFHDAENFGKAFGLPNQLSKGKRGKMTLNYLLDDGATLYLKKETRYFQALLIDKDKQKQKLPNLYINPKILHFTLNSMLPRGTDGKIFFPDDINVAKLPASTIDACEFYLNEKFGEAPLKLVSGKTFTRFQCLALEHDTKKHFLIFDSLTRKVLCPYDEIVK